MARAAFQYLQIPLLLVLLGSSLACANVGEQKDEVPQAYVLLQERQVSFRSNDVIKAGALVMPRGNGPFPAVVFLSPSLPNDRDGTFGELTFFKDFAEHLASNGIAVLRTDDRGVGGSTGAYFESTLLDFSDDAIAAVHFLQSERRIRRDQIGLVGLSEGGAVGPLAASRSADVAFVVMMAGPGLPYLGSAMGQLEDLGKLYGFDASDIRKLQIAHQEVIHVLRENVSTEIAEAKIKETLSRLRDQNIQSPVHSFLQLSPEQEIALMLSLWNRSQVAYDPGPVLTGLKVPLLAITGELDPVLSARRHLPAILKLTAESESLDISIRELSGHNHVFQAAETGKFEEYLTINQTFSNEVLQQIANWILVRFP
jgi:pimeloyl-ACP methyl ester carboxylesterase